MTQPRLLGGRYELDGVVGRGGMAEVYRARDIRLDRIVAVKTLREDLARDQTFQARFRREAQSAASLNHPSIVAVYDTGEDMTGPRPVPYIVMEYVDGRTLRDLLRDDRRLLPERALEITDGVLRALDYSHRNGIVHRDIKPGNVMLTRTGEVKVMDFGIARAVSDAQATMTQTAQVIGTAQYLSPEQARGERVDARSDLYSDRLPAVRAADRPAAVHRRLAGRDRLPACAREPGPALAAGPGDPGLGRLHRAAGHGQGPGGPLPVRGGHADRHPARPVRRAGRRARARWAYAATQRMGRGATMAAADPRHPGYEYGPEEGDYTEGGGGPRRRTWLWWALGALLVLAVLGGVAYAFFGGSGGVAVPQVSGLPVQQATTQVTKAGLTPKEIDVPNSTVQKGIVISTDPANGSLVAAGRR